MATRIGPSLELEGDTFILRLGETEVLKFDKKLNGVANDACKRAWAYYYDNPDIGISELALKIGAGTPVKEVTSKSKSTRGLSPEERCENKTARCEDRQYMHTGLGGACTSPGCKCKKFV